MKNVTLSMIVRKLSAWDDQSTFHCHVDTGRQKQSPEAIVEDLIALQSRCGVIGDLDT